MGLRDEKRDVLHACDDCGEEKPSEDFGTWCKKEGATGPVTRHRATTCDACRAKRFRAQTSRDGAVR